MSGRTNDLGYISSNRYLILTSSKTVDAAFSVADGKQNANDEMATCSRDERQKKTRDEISGAELRTRIFKWERGERGCSKSAPTRTGFQPGAKLVYRSGWRGLAIFSATTVKRGREKMNETGAEIDGEACEGERKVERRQCGAISAEKMGQPLFRICIRGVGHRFAAT